MEVGDRIANCVVDGVIAVEQEHGAVDRHGEPARGQDRRQLVCFPVHLDHEPGRAAANVGERPRVDDLSTLDDHDPVADPLHLLEVMGRDDDVHAELGADATDEIEHLRPLHRVEPVGRLVEEHDLRVVGDRGGKLHALALPRGHRPNGAEALTEADEPERVVGRCTGRAAREQVHLGEVTDEIGRGQLRRRSWCSGA